jgi:hypothetical protein
MNGGPTTSIFCGCCTAPSPAAPLPVTNRSGLPQIAFRIGTFATWREAMLEQIHATPALAALTTRDSDDDAITLLELMAAIGDVLSFYNERTANEMLHRTARERDSLLRMLRMIGYRMRPGLAAIALLSFACDAGAQVAIRQGLKVMTIPGQNQAPATYETLLAITAHGDLNAVPAFAPPVAFNAFRTGATEAPLAAPVALSVGDTLVFFGLGVVEEKGIVALPLPPGGARLRFTPAVQQSGWWPAVTWAKEATRRLRFFGYNAPAHLTTFQPNSSLPAGGTWLTTPIDGSIPAGTNLYPLDARYDDLHSGARLLIDCGAGAAPRLAEVVVAATADRQITVGNLTDTVTHVQLRQTIRGRPSPVPVLGTHGVVMRSGEGIVLATDTVALVPYAPGDLPAASDAVAVGTEPNRVDVFACNAATWLATATWTQAGGWTDWSSVDGAITSNPAPIVLATGELTVFARGEDFGLWVHGILPAFSPWAPLGGLIGSDPVPVSWGGRRIDVFVRGFDRGLWVISRDGGTWSGFQSLQGVLAGAPAAASTGTERLDVVALSDAGTLIHRRFTGTDWTDWLDLGGAALDTPAIIATGSDRVDIFVHGLDGQLWQISRTGEAWSSWTTLGGALGGAPAALSIGGTLFVYVRAADGSLARVSWSGGIWQGWSFPPAGLQYIPDRRSARIWQLGEAGIDFRAYDYPATVAGGRVALRTPGATLGGLALLATGRQLLLQADAVTLPATVTAVEPLASVPGDPPDHLLVDFTPPLAQPAAACTLLGNVAPASQGETQPDETLGNGDATQSFQQFSLGRSPVTYLPDPTEITGTPQLQVLVNGTVWQRVDSLYGRTATARVYTVRQSDAGTTTITLGGSGTGAPVPSGAMNVAARYRVGLGLGGRATAGQLSVLLERPPGLRAVTNPLPSDGGADPEPRDNARVAAPGTVRTFGRIVALSDFELVALASGLIARASATWVWRALERAVFLTVAGPGGAVLSNGTLATLYSLLTAARDPNYPLTLANLVRVPLAVAARLVADPAVADDTVLANARAALLAAFSFEEMGLGQAVHASHVMATLQSAHGVIAVALDVFQLKDFTTLTAKERAVRDVTGDAVQDHIRIFPARPCPTDPSLIDRYARAGFKGAPPPVLAAEQAAILVPATDVLLSVVQAL